MNGRLKRITSIIIMVSTILSISCSAFGVNQNDYLVGMETGKEEAETTYTWPAWGWGAAGAAGGYLHGYIGGGVFAFASTLIEPGVDKKRLATIEGESPQFQEGYIAGFKEVARKKNEKYSFIGAGIGIIILFMSEN